MDFKQCEHMLLKTTPMKGVMLFSMGKLSPWYIGSFEVLDDPGLKAYRLELLPIFSRVYSVLHVYILKVYYNVRDYII